jgi:hypothetical protein
LFGRVAKIGIAVGSYPSEMWVRFPPRPLF